MRVKGIIHAWKDNYVRFVEKQGFGVIAVICVAVITATAVWTDREADNSPSVTPPVLEDISAAQLIQQSLQTSATHSPAPTDAPRIWHAPLDSFTLLRPYDTQRMVKSGTTGIWAIHDAADLAVERGNKVYSVGDGVVHSTGSDKLMGIWLRIDHGDGVEALYSGLALGCSYLPGDPVRGGDVIGYTGDGPLEENDLPPHLHLRVTKEGQSIDPLTLWEQDFPQP